MSGDPNDYYELAMEGEGVGCCLLCDDAEPGCLCFECKCRKCSHYVSGLSGGSCDIADEAKDHSREAEANRTTEYFKQQARAREAIQSVPYRRRTG